MEFEYIMEHDELAESDAMVLAELIDLLDNDLNMFKQYEMIASGADSLVFEVGNFAVKIGVDKSEWYRTKDIVKSLSKVPDGRFMHKYESSNIPMPQLYAYNDYVVVMEKLNLPLLEDYGDESFDDEGTTTWEYMYGEFSYALERYGVLFTDLHDGNVFVDEDSGGLILIDFGYVIELDDHEKRVLVEEMNEMGVEEFHEKYGTSMNTTIEIN